MDFIQGHIECVFGSKPRVGAVRQSAEDSDLCGEGDDCAGDVGCDEARYCCVDVARVGREEGADDKKDLTGRVGWRVAYIGVSLGLQYPGAE